MDGKQLIVNSEFLRIGDKGLLRIKFSDGRLAMFNIVEINGMSYLNSEGCYLDNNERISIPEDYYSSHSIFRIVNDEELRRVEFDASGAIIGYKYLLDIGNKFFSFYTDYSIDNDGVRRYKKFEWVDNSLTADKIPDDYNYNGIYSIKTPNSPVFEEYHYYPNKVLVRLLLSGKIIEFNYGYRAEHADIIGIVRR